jgi:hypothetical protein
VAGPGGHVKVGHAIRAAIAEWAITAMRAIADGGLPVLAVRHPLGFTCLPVERAGRDGVCVHVWGAAASSGTADPATPTTSAVHAHCWELSSYALFGTLENRIIVVDDAPGPGDDMAGEWLGEPGLYRVLGVRSAGDTDELVLTSRLVRCATGHRQVITAGDVYSMPAGVFHATDVPAGTEAATVVLGRQVPEAEDWSLGPPGSAPHRVRRWRYDAAQTAVIARAVLGRLLAAAPCPA